MISQFDRLHFIPTHVCFWCRAMFAADAENPFGDPAILHRDGEWICDDCAGWLAKHDQRQAEWAQVAS